MAHAAILELLGVNGVFLDQLPAEHELVRSRPIQIENFFARANKIFRRAMAIETPFHIKRVRLPGQRHLIKLAVAGRATDAVIDMDAVIEEDKVGRVVDAVPAQRLIVRQALAYRRQHRRVLPDLRMARHAGFGGRHSSEGR